ncbi:hypothetical protein GQ43DRAFT_443249 [Delitschia confertaspora ATCC 74209]|uniref:histone acetyltransferase n=1 Tax=Delitschia confertaspora ATCC 74209 TaxID=1513339 RepID=A0A9P4JHU5_9PLEO|nr:hypothetical protein GQ43DRAFT_443249 [Delitschia confertaspora ATCC 74209]
MAKMTSPKSLKELLADSLPKDVPFTFYHYSTPPSRSPSLYSAPPHRKKQRTYCESHFLAVSIAPKGKQEEASPEELLILAIEVLIYTTQKLTTIFVSKADSTGCIAALNLPRSQSGSPLKAVCGTFLSWLVKERQREGKKSVVSLFARAQDQYLFPASVDNENKHVLDDRGLVKWWCKVLDPLVREYAGEDEKQSLTERLNDMKAESATSAITRRTARGINTAAKGYLVIPGYEPYDTARFIPPPPTATAPRRWVTTHPLREIAPFPAAPPRCLIPHFPDDPKTRFLDELDEELPDRDSRDMTQLGGTPSRSNGQWKSVKTLEQFWEMMAYRQECSSGRITGFIWVVITPPKPSIPEEDEELSPSQSQSQSQPHSLSQSFSTPEKKPPPTPKSAVKSVKSIIKSATKKPRRRPVNTTSGPIPLLLPRIKSHSSQLSASSTSSSSGAAHLPPESSPYYLWPASSRGSLLFSPKDYDRAHEVLIQQNFSTRTAAAKSTRRWKEEVGVLGGVENWGWTVVGRKEAVIESSPVANGAAPSNGVTMLVTKKRKAMEKGEASGQATTNGDRTNILEGELVRKKVKTEDAGVGAGAAKHNGVNILSAGMVRKKPKP